MSKKQKPAQEPTCFQELEELSSEISTEISEAASTPAIIAALDDAIKRDSELVIGENETGHLPGVLSLVAARRAFAERFERIATVTAGKGPIKPGYRKAIEADLLKLESQTGQPVERLVWAMGLLRNWVGPAPDGEIRHLCAIPAEVVTIGHDLVEKRGLDRVPVARKKGKRPHIETDAQLDRYRKPPVSIKNMLSAIQEEIDGWGGEREPDTKALVHDLEAARDFIKAHAGRAVKRAKSGKAARK